MSGGRGLWFLAGVAVGVFVVPKLARYVVK